MLVFKWLSLKDFCYFGLKSSDGSMIFFILIKSYYTFFINNIILFLCFKMYHQMEVTWIFFFYFFFLEFYSFTFSFHSKSIMSYFLFKKYGLYGDSIFAKMKVVSSFPSMISWKDYPFSFELSLLFCKNLSLLYLLYFSYSFHVLFIWKICLLSHQYQVSWLI